MTYRYSDINQHDALYTIARKYPGGVEALAGRMGIPVSTMYKKLRPAVETHAMSFEETSMAIEHCVEARVADALLPVHAFCWRHGLVAIQLPDAEVDDSGLMQQVLAVFDEAGKLAGEINDALRTNNDITDSELDKIEAVMEREIAALVTLREKVRAKHEADKKKGGAM